MTFFHGSELTKYFISVIIKDTKIIGSVRKGCYMIIKQELITREIAGETVLVPVGKSVYDANGLFVLNDLATFIWTLLPNVDTQEQICQAILAEYDVDAETAARDVAEFIDALTKMNIL